MMVILLVVITKNKLRRNNMHECHYQVDFLSPAGYSDFQKEWYRTAAYALGCTSINLIKTSMSNDKYTQKRFESFVKKNSKIDKPYPGKHSVNSYDMGVDHYEIWQNKVKILNHKRQEVQVRKSYKTKPSAVPSGASLKEIHRFKCDIDYRSYDPLEHGGESREEFLRNQGAYIRKRYNLLPVVRQESKSRKTEYSREL